MSFLDLAALAMHRRTEMEDRINVLVRKCDHAQGHLNKLKVQAQSLVEQLNCEPQELKDRFLSGMKQLDEYIYLVTDINLSFANIEIESIDSQPETKPVQDAPSILMPVLQPHLLDILSDPVPSTSTTSTACHRVEHVPKKKPTRHQKKLDIPQALIEFSSTSCSQESVPGPRGHMVEKEVQCEVPVEEIKKLQISEFPEPGEKLNLPKQHDLQLDVAHRSCIMHVDGSSLWLIAGDIDDARRLMVEMSEFYMQHPAPLPRSQLEGATYCAYCDQDSGAVYRAMFLQIAAEHADIAQVFLVDTGEVRFAQLDALRPLARRHHAAPPHARLAHLAAIDIIEGEGGDSLARHEDFLHKYLGRECEVIVDDNSSESLGVFVWLGGHELLNQLMVEEGLASTEIPEERPPISTSGPPHPSPPSRGPPEMFTSSELDIIDCPEYEDPVEAVTGYHNRDEIDICKHYKGGAERKCFKGARCKKKHIRKHPDGWSLDRVPAGASARRSAGELPAPGENVRARVTCVEHFDCVWLQFITVEPVDEHKRSFGEALPPLTLEALERDMNSPVGRAAHRPFKLAPGPGELVAAQYPPDGRWYRAIVLALEHFDQLVEVQYVDYGNKMSIKESQVRQLDLRYTLLPLAATRAKLAGVRARSAQPEQWAAAKRCLEDLALNKTLSVLIVEREYDEVVAELSVDGRSCGEQLAELGLVDLQSFAVVDDSCLPRRTVVP